MDLSEKPDEEILALLDQFDWNWHLAADYLDCDAEELKGHFSHQQPRSPAAPKTRLPFNAAHIRQDDLIALQEMVREMLVDPLPVLFDDNMPPERRANIAADILFEKGLTYKLTHHQDFKDAYAVVEDEAITLARWRDQVNYLTVIEEALFKISARLAREERHEGQGEDELEQES
jgi:hypothetical protein